MTRGPRPGSEGEKQLRGRKGAADQRNSFGAGSGYQCQMSLTGTEGKILRNGH